MATNGDLELDPETDTSGARFVTRASVQRCWMARSQGRRRRSEPVATVPLAGVVRFTGLGGRVVVDLIRAGALEELPAARRPCEITAASLEAWLAGRRDGNCHEAQEAGMEPSLDAVGRTGAD